MPYPFYSPDDLQWASFAENCEDGSSTNFIKTVRATLTFLNNHLLSFSFQLAKKFRMIIISPIAEREEAKFYNTSVIISSTGEILGKHRKNHIPPIEAEFLSAGDFNHQVYETEFGKIGIVICYERHFPLNWLVLGLNGAEIVFNPSSEDEDSLSERMWLVEGRTAAVANGLFTVNVNRTGTENFSSGQSIKYFGSSYVAAPDGKVSPNLSQDYDGLLIVEVDLKACERAKEEFSFHRNQHLKKYVQQLQKF